MLKEILTALSLSLLLSAAASAHAQPVIPGQEANVLAQAPEDNPMPVQPPREAEPKEAAETKELLYKFGVAGFLRGEGAGNYRFADYSYAPGHTDARFLYRAKPYLAWNPAEYLGFTVEGQAYGFAGKGDDDWWLSLYQGYVEIKFPGTSLLSLRAGRQEFSYGSAFLLGPDAFYNGLSFDGARLRIQPLETLSLDLLGGRYASPWSDGVNGNLFGAYASFTPSDGHTLEAYLLSDTGSMQHHKGEVVHSVGLRGVGKFGPLSVEFEPVYQFGETLNTATGVNDDISAYGGHLDLSAEFKIKEMRHKFWLGYAMGSGSRAAAEGVTSRREFRNPDNDTALVGDMNVFGDLSGANVAGHHASGLHIYTAGWGIDLTPALNLSATAHYFRAGEVEAGFSRDLGLETDFCLTYTVSDNYSLLVAYDRLFSGKFFGNAAGERDDVHYGYAMLQFNLEKAKLKAPKAVKGA